MIVVDASVAVNWVLPEADSGLAVALREACALIAPSLVIAEIGNALWKSVLRGDVDKSDAYDALQIAVAHFERIVSIDELAASSRGLFRQKYVLVRKFLKTRGILGKIG